MSYFNYHAKIKSLIKQGELVDIKILDSYNNIKPAMVFYFKNHKPMPVREYRFDEYINFLNQYEQLNNIKK